MVRSVRLYVWLIQPVSRLSDLAIIRWGLSFTRVLYFLSALTRGLHKCQHLGLLSVGAFSPYHLNPSSIGVDALMLISAAFPAVWSKGAPVHCSMNVTAPTSQHSARPSDKPYSAKLTTLPSKEGVGYEQPAMLASSSLRVLFFSHPALEPLHNCNGSSGSSSGSSRWRRSLSWPLYDSTSFHRDASTVDVHPTGSLGTYASLFFFADSRDRETA